MATRSFICLPDDNGTFSARYHHWDGYVDGLGEYLHEMVGTLDKAKWLFGLNRSFSTIMSTIPSARDEKWYHERYSDKEKVVNWPKDWEDNKKYRKTFLECHPADDADGCLDHEPWEKVSDFCNEAYTYIFKDGSWQVFLVQDGNWSRCVTIDVKILSTLHNICKHLQECPAADVKSIAAALDTPQKTIKSALKFWGASGDDIRNNFMDKYQREDYDQPPEFMLDALNLSLTLKKELKNSAGRPRSSKIKL